MQKDKICSECGAKPRYITCDFCGRSGYITDCGHQSQPRPIAATEDGWRVICEDCVDLYGPNGPEEE